MIRVEIIDVVSPSEFYISEKHVSSALSLISKQIKKSRLLQERQHSQGIIANNSINENGKKQLIAIFDEKKKWRNG